MPMVPRAPGNPNQDVLAQGAAALGEGIGAMLVRNRRQRRLNEERSMVEQQIREAPDLQSALTAIETAPWQVKEAFHDDLVARARERFPEMELMATLDPEGRIKNIAHPKGRPLTDEDIRAQGLEPARQFLIVSHDEKGNIEIHDVALGSRAAEEDLKTFQQMFPGRRFQIAQGPETETFLELQRQQIARQRIQTDRETTHKQTPTDIMFAANIRAEIENDPLATEQGAAVLESKRDDIRRRFEQFNGQFKGEIFSLESPESASLVQNGISVTSALIARGYNLERATDIGFNMQIAGSIVSNLLKQQQPDSAVAKEGERRFGVNPATLQAVMDRVAQSEAFRNLREFDPKSDDPDVIAQPVAGGVTLLFAKINGRLVPIGKR